MTLLVSEPHRAEPPRTLRDAVVEPFHEFITRSGWQNALLILAFLFFYKLGDSLCTALATPFYLDMGFSKSQIGLIAKNAGLWPAVIGALLGGIWMLKIGINRALWMFGAVQVVSIFGFYWLALQGAQVEVTALHLTQLAFVIGLEAFGVALFGAIIVWISILLSHLSFRRRHKVEDLPVRMPFFPGMQIAGLVLLVAVLITMGLDKDVWRISWIVGAPWLMLVSAGYFIWKARLDAAARARELGIVTEVAAAGALGEASARLAGEIAGAAPLALAAARVVGDRLGQRLSEAGR